MKCTRNAPWRHAWIFASWSLFWWSYTIYSTVVTLCVVYDCAHCIWNVRLLL